jgi:hypothetical protein
MGLEDQGNANGVPDATLSQKVPVAPDLPHPLWVRIDHGDPRASGSPETPSVPDQRLSFLFCRELPSENAVEHSGQPSHTINNMPTPHLPIKIHIDKKLCDAPKETMSGAELKTLGGVKSDRDLFKTIPGKDDLLVKDADLVTLKPGDHFYSAPSSLNPGCCAA